MSLYQFLGLIALISVALVIIGCRKKPSSQASASTQPTAFVADKLVPPQPTVVVTDRSATASREPSPVTVTPKAAAIIRQIAADQGTTQTVYLRLRLTPGGRDGFMHKLDLDQEVTPADHISESEGVKVVVFKRQVEMLRGCRVDYGDVDGKKGFKIENPSFVGEAAKKWMAQLEQENDVK